MPQQQAIGFIVLLVAMTLNIACGGCPSTEGWVPDADGHVHIPPNTTSIDEKMFKQCENLISVFIPSTVERISKAAFMRSGLEVVKIEEDSNLKEIGQNAFRDCRKLKGLDLPTSLNTIEKYAFENSGLHKINLPESLTSIGNYAFQRCPADCLSFSNPCLTTGWNMSVTIPDNLTKIGRGVFEESGLTDLILPSLTEIPPDLCKLCYYLRNVSFSENVTVIGESAFKWTAGLRSVNLGEKLEKIGTYAFQFCNLTSVTIPDSVTTINSTSFQKCQSLESVVIGAKVALIERKAFQFIGGHGADGSDGIQNITFKTGENDRSLTIGERAFEEQLLLQEIVIPPNVTKLVLKEYSFDDCRDLSKFILGADVKYLSISGQSFRGTNLTAETIHFPRDLAHLNLDYDYTDDRIVVECSSDSCGCKVGYEYIKSEDERFFTCSPCPAGSTSSNASCSPCPTGRYNPSPASECLLCKSGKFWNKTGNTEDCKNCTAGKYSFSGASACDECPAGYYCGGPGLQSDKIEQCESGSFAMKTNSIMCDPCPAGTYQGDKGQAFCTDCVSGKYNSINYSTTSEDCLECPIGTFSQGQGASGCTPCVGENTIASSSGRSVCESCREEEIANEAKSACVPRTSTSSSMILQMFKDGSAIGGTFAVTALFMLVAGVVTYYRESSPTKLANYTRLEAIYNSFLAGFGFGSTIFLIMSISQVNPGLGTAMILFRLLHFVAGAVLLVVIFAPASFVRERVDPRVNGASLIRDYLDADAMQSHIYIIEMVSFVAMLDVTMFQFMPWKKSRFFVLSEGYPSLGVMKFCLCFKLVELLAIFACEASYISSKPPDTIEEEALFALNILFGVVSIFLNLLVVLLRGRILDSYSEDKEDGDAGEDKVTGENSAVEDIPLDGIYGGDNDSDNFTLTENPMRAADLGITTDTGTIVSRDGLISEQKRQIEEKLVTIDFLKHKAESLRQRKKSFASSIPEPGLARNQDL